MDFLNILQIIVVVTTCVGVGIVALHRVEGFYILCISQILGIYYFIMTDQFWLAGEMVVLTIFNGYGIYNWKKKGVGKEPVKWPWKKKEKGEIKWDLLD